MALVWTYTSSHTLGAPEEVNWVQHGSGISVSFSSGDHFGAQATSSGLVMVYKNTHS